MNTCLSHSYRHLCQLHHLFSRLITSDVKRRTSSWQILHGFFPSPALFFSSTLHSAYFLLEHGECSNIAVESCAHYLIMPRFERICIRPRKIRLLHKFQGSMSWMDKIRDSFVYFTICHLSLSLFRVFMVIFWMQSSHVRAGLRGEIHAKMHFFFFRKGLAEFDGTAQINRETADASFSFSHLFRFIFFFWIAFVTILQRVSDPSTLQRRFD